MKNILFKITLTVTLTSTLFTSCKKDKTSTPIVAGSRSDLTKDSIFLYAKDVYLWNDALPTYQAFNPRKFNSLSSNLDNFNAELFAISQIKINPITGKPYEYSIDDPSSPKYSYIEDLVASGKLIYNNNSESSVGLDGEGDDFGYSLALVGNNANYKIYFEYTSPGSPCALAGLGRGDIIDEINGRKIGTNFSADDDFINTAINANTIAIAGLKTNGIRYSVTLNQTKYTSSPIYKDAILTVGAKKVGYFAYARFSDSDNSEAALSNVFSKFAAAAVTDLVIDLRYNGGGYVSTAEHLINLIAPSSVNGKVMFSEAFNSSLQAGKTGILKNQPIRDQNGDYVYFNGRIATYADESYTIANNTFNIEKKGSLTNVSKVVFIITDRTASASELVINSLKPYVDVKIVGSTSYGKPVGFFPIRIDKYDVYMSMFSTTNSLGQGDYFAGFTPNSVKADDVTRDFGNPAEISLSAALSYINTGLFTSSSTTQTMSINGKSTSPSVLTIKEIYNPYSFKGMIHSPRRSR